MEDARPATADDVPAIASLARALRSELRELRGGRLWDTRDGGAEPLEGSFAELLTRDDACLLVGTIDGSVVGYGFVVVETLRDGSRLGVIPELYVEPGGRSVGVGEALAGALVAYCERAGCAGVDATALPGHREAKNFFERNGFTARSLTMHRPLSEP